MGTEEIQSEILQRLTRVETKLDMQLNAKDLALESLEKGKSAHIRLNDHKNRLDELDKHFDNEVKLLNIKSDNEIRAIYTRVDTEIEGLKRTRLEDIKERKLDRRWLIGMLITVGGLTIAVISLALKSAGL